MGRPRQSGRSRGVKAKAKPQAARAQSSQPQPRKARRGKRKAEAPVSEVWDDEDDAEMWEEPDVVSEEELEEDSSEAEVCGPSLAGGNSEADRVYRELLRQGATPAIVGKRRKASPNEEEVEMELFTPGAAKKARLIPEEPGFRRSRSHGMPGMPGMPSGLFSSFFGF